MHMLSQERLLHNFNAMKEFTDTEDGITRLAFSDEDWRAREFISGLMKKAGLAVRSDSFGNLIGRREGSDPAADVVMFGSHIDSVPKGGNFDGVMGVLASIEVINWLNENDFVNENPLEVVVFMAEESSRFGAANLGSRAFCGTLTSSELDALVDDMGISLADMLRYRGLDPALLDTAKYTGKIKSFIEIHIEQGKLLEAAGKQIGIVTGIAAPTRLKIILAGDADHSGATPMYLRHDGLCAASEIILLVEKLAKEAKGELVGTVGAIQVSPGVMNVIPGRVELGVDIRSTSMSAKNHMVKQLLPKIKEIAAQRDMPVDIKTIVNETPVIIQEMVQDALIDICKATDYSYMKLPSGAGHDAMHIAAFAPTGMIFIPCKGGISHNPAEAASIEHIVAATDVLYQAICKLSQKEFKWKQSV